jgi:leader peptidase (prepilin peptidase)/N-methyltransferase
MTNGVSISACLDHMPVTLMLKAMLFAALLCATSDIDIRSRVIPNSICAALALTSLIAFSPRRLPGVLAALPLLAAAMIKPGSIGGGDIKLTAAAGLVLGFGGGITGLIIGLAAFLLFFASGSIIKRKSIKETQTALPMAPFLSAGFIAAYIFQITGSQPG